MIKHVCFPHEHQSFFWGKHLLNKNNYQVLEMFDIIFVWDIIHGPIMHNVFKNIVILWVFQQE
jgi:hypothetical protein